MKEVRLAYGVDGVVAHVPDDAVVLTPTDLPVLDDEAGALLAALRDPIGAPPLERCVPRTGSVVVVFPDLTRPMPNRTVLPPLLAELERCGAGPDRVSLLCATGTHRRATDAEMRALVGDDLVDRYAVHDHGHDDPHVEVGRVDGVAVEIDRRYVEADLRIVTGFVEPHFFAGFSGGPKGVCPGLATLATILQAHSPARIADPRATFVTTRGNPVHDFVRAAAALAPPTLSVDVAINRDRGLTAVFAGALPVSHDAACAFVERTAVQPVQGRFDVVLTSNNGYPLDRNLYQSVKGLAAAERVVADDGAIVLAAACVDGLPEGGGFAWCLDAARDPADLRAGTNGGGGLDGWQAQVLGRVLQRAAVWLHTDGLGATDIRRAQLRPAPDLDDAVAEALAAGRGARVCVLPEGPLTVAAPS